MASARHPLKEPKLNYRFLSITPLAFSVDSCVCVCVLGGRRQVFAAEGKKAKNKKKNREGKGTEKKNGVGGGEGRKNVYISRQKAEVYAFNRIKRQPAPACAECREE